ncbi:ABC transporter ATP-binding protein [Alkalicoccus urumqiensis]|uniref:Multidrug ABC transporter ATP-binding protein n=1 Tax=Alkalicoccus urumqiensis TaxID=1548213 RepID=A0A2P6MIL6_ALKUR|nr:ABC transporter ATP-binding protein [Alkalicoccus urumqiensis]PRO66144.1 multidrug ABC transporter ATP-binding protein [Alkalicoccus urumqiensis]
MRNSLKEPFQYPKIDTEPPEQAKRRADDWKGTLRRLGAYLLVHKKKLVLTLLMVALSSSMALLGPLIVGLSIDELLVNENTGILLPALAGLAAVYVLHSVSVYLQHYWMLGAAQKTIYTLRTDFFDHLQLLPVGFFDKRRHGELMSRMTNDMDNISNTLNTSVIQLGQSLLTLGGVLVVMLYLSPMLTAVTLFIVPAMYFGMKWITRRTGPLFKAQQSRLGDMTGYTQETLNGQQLIQAYSQEERVMASFNDYSRSYRLAAFWAQTISGFIPKLMNMLNNAGFAVIAGVGGILALQGYITVGVIVIFAEYARQFTRPLNDLANQFNVLLSAIAGAERVFTMMDEPKEETRASKRMKRPVRGAVSFEHVTFAYEQETIIDDVTFRAEPGEMIAFAGPTGAGKTTLISLLARFYEPASGSILLDGEPISGYGMEELRGEMAFVLQDSYLFAGSIRENIRYGRLDASDEEVEAAAEAADAGRFIRRLPDGYETKLGSGGSGISQGQKQLLSIARALLADPAVLVLDEATSSIDTITELHIQRALKRLMKGRTSIVIAHRLNTIRRADTIVVLEEGRVVEQGSHDELIQQSGSYQAMIQSQQEGKAEMA